MFFHNGDYLLDVFIRFSHHSTAIEGNTLSMDDAISIMLHGFIAKPMSEREFFEVKNHKNLMPPFVAWLENAEPITLSLIQKTHGILMEHLIYNAGAFKKTQNAILGAPFETAEPFQVLERLKAWCDNLIFKLNAAENEDSKLLAIFESHVQFERIHPFSDGNGRVGRALMAYSCFAENILPIVIPSDKKAQYIHFLNTAKLADFLAMAKELQKVELKRWESFEK